MNKYYLHDCYWYGVTSIWPLVTSNDLWGQTQIDHNVFTCYMSIHTKNGMTGSFFKAVFLIWRLWPPVTSNDLRGKIYLDSNFSTCHMNIHAKYDFSECFVKVYPKFENFDLQWSLGFDLQWPLMSSEVKYV